MIQMLPSYWSMYGLPSRIYKSTLLSVRGIRNRLSFCLVHGFVLFQLREMVHEAVPLPAWPADCCHLSGCLEWKGSDMSPWPLWDVYPRWCSRMERISKRPGTTGAACFVESVQRPSWWSCILVILHMGYPFLVMPSINSLTVTPPPSDEWVMHSDRLHWAY